MRTLKFTVNGQRLKRIDDNKVLVAGSQRYLKVSFDFSDEWTGFNKVASFSTSNGEDYAVMIKDNECEVPSEVLGARLIKLRVIGKRGDTIIPSTKAYIRQVM